MEIYELSPDLIKVLSSHLDIQDLVSFANTCGFFKSHISKINLFLPVFEDFNFENSAILSNWNWVSCAKKLTPRTLYSSLENVFAREKAAKGAYTISRNLFELKSLDGCLSKDKQFCCSKIGIEASVIEAYVARNNTKVLNPNYKPVQPSNPDCAEPLPRIHIRSG